MNNAFYIFYFFIFISNSISAQTNLIYNGDFEIYDTCPSNLSQPGDYQINHCLGWTNANTATPDYFNVCSTNNLVTIPFNITGFQNPKSGNAYCGFLAYSYQPPPFEVIWWEYLKGQLVNNLESDIIYKISFSVTLSELDKLSVSKLGISFTNFNYFQNDSLTLQNMIFQESNNIGFLKDTNNWMLLEFYYQAQGNEKYLIIGNPRNPIETELLVTNGDSTLVDNAYYLIDDVVVNEIEIEIPNIFSPNQDGINDLFKITNAFGETEINIFNRWGESVNRLYGMNSYWDGHTSVGMECPDGIYYYLIKIENLEFTGFVHLVR